VACTEPLDAPVPGDPEDAEPPPSDPVPEDADPGELLPDDPPEVLSEPLLAEAPLPDDVLPCVEAGSVAAMAPVASTLATPTPAVTTDSRFMPRCRSAAGGAGRPPGLLGIGHPLSSPRGRVCVRTHGTVPS
jgi:hypothetical protein